jgi:hypothetical protein
MPEAFLIERCGCGGHFFRGHVFGYCGLGPGDGYVGAYQGLAECLLQGFVFFQCIQGFVGGGGERPDAAGGSFLVAQRGGVDQGGLAGVQVAVYAVQAGLSSTLAVADSLPATGEASLTAASLLSTP